MTPPPITTLELVQLMRICTLNQVLAELEKTEVMLPADYVRIGEFYRRASQQPKK